MGAKNSLFFNSAFDVGTTKQGNYFRRVTAESAIPEWNIKGQSAGETASEANSEQWATQIDLSQLAQQFSARFPKITDWFHQK